MIGQRRPPWIAVWVRYVLVLALVGFKGCVRKGMGAFNALNFAGLCFAGFCIFSMWIMFFHNTDHSVISLVLVSVLILGIVSAAEKLNQQASAKEQEERDEREKLSHLAALERDARRLEVNYLNDPYRLEKWGFPPYKLSKPARHLHQPEMTLLQLLTSLYDEDDVEDDDPPPLPPPPPTPESMTWKRITP